MSYRYDHEDWFSIHIPLWDAILVPLKPKKIIEIGSFEGRSAVHMIEICSQFNELEITCIDPWNSYAELANMDFQRVEDNFDHNIAEAVNTAPNIVSVYKVRGPSITGLSKLLATNYGQADLIYIDGSHYAADVLADAVMAFPLLRVGGAMIFDDYNSPNPETPEFPKLGIDAFLRVYDNKIKPIPFNIEIDGRTMDLNEYTKTIDKKLYQLYIVKVSE